MIPRIEKKQFVMSIAVIAITVVFLFVQYLPLNGKARELKAKNVLLISEISSLGNRLDVLPELHQEIEKLRQQNGDFDAKIPVGRAHGEFLQSLASVMKQQGLGELIIQPGEEVQAGEIFRIPVYIRCEGKLIHIFKFFKAMESFQRIIQIEEISMTGSNKFDGTLTMQAKTNIFYRNK